MQIVPNSFGTLREFNPCHSPSDGRFCPAGAHGEWAGSRTRITKSRRATTSAMRDATDKEKKRMGIPPAYTNVKVATNPNAELRATAVTAKGKTAYFYAKSYTDRQATAKWSRIVAFQADSGKIADKISKEIAVHGPNYHEAMTLRLIMQTGMRNGIEADGTFGATSLRMHHVTVDGDTVRMQFPGKGGVKQDQVVRDSVLAHYVRQRREEGADQLFPHDADVTLSYLKTISGGKFKVHDIRTWYGTIYADHLVKEMLREGMAPKTKKEYKAFRKAVATKVSAQLGNTPSVALSTYIHPKVFPHEL